MEFIVELGFDFGGSLCYVEKERITRCRDCENFCEGAEDGNPCYCGLNFRSIGPDGYCAWAKRKSDDT